MFTFKSTSQEQTTDSATGMSMDTDDSFVHVSDTDQPSLSLKVIPRHESIGIDATVNSTEFCATVTAKEIPEDDDSMRAPVDIMVALDVSGSMNGSKLDLCKTTLALLLRELRASDRFGLISFGSDVKLEIPLRKLTQANKDHALAKIKSLKTRGCTNMSGGIGMAAQEIKSIESPHEVRTIFLLTDGLPNEGVSDREGIVNLTKGCLGSNGGQNPIPIHCFGYGSDHDSEMLRDISAATEGGTYYYVGSDSDVSSAFGDALGGVLSVVAQNTIVSLKVPQESANSGISILNVKHDNAKKNPDGSYSISLNDFYAEESRDIIFEVSLTSESSSAPVVHVSSSMSYLDTINSKLVQSDSVEGSLSRPIGNEISQSNHHVSLQCIRIKTTEVIAEAEKLADSGQYDRAKKIISSYINELQKEAVALGESNPSIVQMLNELNSIMTGLSSRTTYESYGGAYMKSRVQTHKWQRCSEASEMSPSVYKSKAKKSRAYGMKNASLNYK